MNLGRGVFPWKKSLFSDGYINFHSEERIKYLKNLNFPEFSVCNNGMFNHFFQQNPITKTILLITNCTIMKYNPY